MDGFGNWAAGFFDSALDGLVAIKTEEAKADAIGTGQQQTITATEVPQAVQNSPAAAQQTQWISGVSNTTVIVGGIGVALGIIALLR